jgi:hypothetical protein
MSRTKMTTDGGTETARRYLSREDTKRMIAGYYFARRHVGPNLRRRARRAIKEARGE